MIILNIFVALILDNFIIKWERSQVLGTQSTDTTVFHMTLLEMYKDILDPPSMEYVQQILINVSDEKCLNTICNITHYIINSCFLA